MPTRRDRQAAVHRDGVVKLARCWCWASNPPATRPASRSSTAAGPAFRACWAHALHSQVRHARGLRRRGARAGQPRPHPPRAAADPRRCCRRPAANWPRSTRWPTPAARAWPARCWWARAWPARWARRWASRCWACTTSKGHLLSPFLSADPPEFPFVALLVSGGHTQLMRVDGVGQLRAAGRDHRRRRRRGLRQVRQAAGPGLSGRAGAVAAGASRAMPTAFKLPRPLLHSGNLDFSFAGLKTAVLTQARKLGDELRGAQGRPGRLDRRRRSSRCW